MSMKDIDSRLTDVPGAAAWLHTSERHIRHLIANRKIPFTRVGRLIRFDVNELDRWLESNSVPVGGTDR